MSSWSATGNRVTHSRRGVTWSLGSRLSAFAARSRDKNTPHIGGSGDANHEVCASRAGNRSRDATSWRRTMRQTNGLRALLLGVAILNGCSDTSHVATEPGYGNGGAMDLAIQPDQPTGADADSVQIVRASGDIEAAVAEYRTLLGTFNPPIAGEQAGGRREVSWD